MNWLIWRQHRKQLLIFTGLLAGFAAIAIPSGLHFWQHYQTMSAQCANNCNPIDLRNEIFKTQSDGLIVNFVKLALLGLPLLLGLFVGVPLLAREYAEKTNKLVWTQGISRNRWLMAKVAWVLLATAVYAGIFSAIATWFSRTGNTVSHDRFAALAFSSQAIVPVAIAVFAVSVGFLFGAWFKKVLPALGATLGFLLVLQIAVPLLARPHYAAQSVYNTSSLLNADKKNGDPFSHPLPNDKDAWVVSDRMVNNHGQVFDWSSPPSSCKVSDPAAGIKDNPGEGVRHAIYGRNNVNVDMNCLTALGYHWEIKYQPGRHYWSFQYIETGLYAALSLAAVGATYVLVLKRDA
jgi:ABC-type transport system involved in multi-copper enzyme maturation permease subunit